MGKLSTNEIRVGSKLLIDGFPYVVIINDAVKPGKGQAFNRIKLKNIKTSRVIEKTYKSGDVIDEADINDVDMAFLYNDGSSFVFMDPATFEQISVDSDTVGDAAKWIKENDVCVVTIWDENPISVLPPTFIVSRIVECEPAVRGDTVNGVMKNVKIETGAEIKVPLFVDLNDFVRIDTRSGEYICRVKDEE